MVEILLKAIQNWAPVMFICHAEESYTCGLWLLLIHVRNHSAWQISLCGPTSLQCYNFKANVRHQYQTPGILSGSDTSHVILKSGWLGFQAHTFFHWFNPEGFLQKAQADHWPKAAVVTADRKRIIGREQERMHLEKQHQHHHCRQRKGD